MDPLVVLQQRRIEVQRRCSRETRNCSGATPTAILRRREHKVPRSALVTVRQQQLRGCADESIAAAIDTNPAAADSQARWPGRWPEQMVRRHEQARQRGPDWPAAACCAQRSTPASLRRFPGSVRDSAPPAPRKSAVKRHRRRGMQRRTSSSSRRLAISSGAPLSLACAGRRAELVVRDLRRSIGCGAGTAGALGRRHGAALLGAAWPVWRAADRAAAVTRRGPDCPWPAARPASHQPAPPGSSAPPIKDGESHASPNALVCKVQQLLGLHVLGRHLHEAQCACVPVHCSCLEDVLQQRERVGDVAQRKQALPPVMMLVAASLVQTLAWRSQMNGLANLARRTSREISDSASSYCLRHVTRSQKRRSPTWT